MNNVKSITRRIEVAPSKCFITNLPKCEIYMIDDTVVYITDPAYTAYALPVYDREGKCFYRTKFCLESNTQKTNDFLVNLSDLSNHENIKDILSYYNISEGELNES